jgi:cytoskeletal protein RodZ
MSEVPASPGAALAAARIRRGLSLDEITRQTRIQRHALEALEADDFEALPAMVYVRGFVRLYAQAVGLDPAMAVGLLDERLHDRARAEETAQTEAEARLSAERWARARVRVTYAFAAVIALAIGLAAVFSLSTHPIQARHLVPDSPATADAAAPATEAVAEAAPSAADDLPTPSTDDVGDDVGAGEAAAPAAR